MRNNVKNNMATSRIPKNPAVQKGAKLLSYARSRELLAVQKDYYNNPSCIDFSSEDQRSSVHRRTFSPSLVLQHKQEQSSCCAEGFTKKSFLQKGDCEWFLNRPSLRKIKGQ